MFSVIIPVYRNEGSIAQLVEALGALNTRMGGDLEAVFVVDGSPDRSLELLSTLLPKAAFSSQLLALSRNFGSLAAVTAGMASARGQFCVVMAADLQEPPELILEMRQQLETGRYDVVVGTRVKREDPLLTRLFSSIFWKVYRLVSHQEIPSGGVDIFACSREFRDHLLALREHHTTLIGLIFWLGFRRGEVKYSRRARQHGKSAWSFARRVRYFLDSAFAFSDLPVRLMTLIGIFGILLACALAGLIVFARLSGKIEVPGYSATALLIVFFGGLNSLGLGLIGEYVWRTFENTKSRPAYLIARRHEFGVDRDAQGKA